MSDLVEQLEEIQARIAELKIQESALIAEILAQNEIGDVIEHDGRPYARIEQPMKFSAVKAQEVLSAMPKVLKQVMVPSVTITAASAKNVLSPELYDQCKIPNGQPKIKFITEEEE